MKYLLALVALTLVQIVHPLNQGEFLFQLIGVAILLLIARRMK